MAKFLLIKHGTIETEIDRDIPRRQHWHDYKNKVMINVDHIICVKEIDEDGNIPRYLLIETKGRDFRTTETDLPFREYNMIMNNG